MIAPLVTVYCSGPSSPLMVSTIECLVHTCPFLRPPSSSSCFPFLGKNKLSSSLSSMSSWFSQCHLLLSLGILPQLSISKTPIVLNLCSPSWGKKKRVLLLLLLLLLDVTVVSPSNNCSSLGFCLNLALAKSPPQLLVLKLADSFRCQPPP